MTDKILITGANGQLGTELKNRLPNAIYTDINVLDITDLKAVQDFVKNNKIDIIVNCAAYTAVDKAEEENEIAQNINEYGAYNLALTGAKIIHISTDYVFNGKNYKPYLTTDETQPICKNYVSSWCRKGFFKCGIRSNWNTNFCR